MIINSINLKLTKAQIDFLKENKDLMEEVNAYLTPETLIDLASQIRDLEMDEISAYHSGEASNIELGVKIDPDGNCSIGIDSIDAK
jgi:hypothetical protein